MITIGKVVGTHGIKGEIKIRSNFQYKEQVFKPNFIIYLGDDLTPHIIKSYRRHKEFEMITFDNYININDVLLFKGKDVKIKKEDLSLNNEDYLNDDLIGCSVYYQNKNYGKIINFVYNKGNDLLMIENEEVYYIPFNNNFIESVDITSKMIILKNVEGLIK